MIYLAPIQGFTDFVYRRVYSELFTGVDAFFIPYISVKNNRILKKHERETALKNNPQNRVVPQVLAKDPHELLSLSGTLKTVGYNEINLNLGCPYPMVTRRGKGAGLLTDPEKLRTMLDAFFMKPGQKLSVKLRAGLVLPTEIEAIIPVLNEFPLTEIIFHPRLAKQLYKGEILDSAFRVAAQNLKHKLVYNGDIFSLKDFENRKQMFPEIDDWMLGRGVLMNPFLPAEIKGGEIQDEEKIEVLQQFHQKMLEGYNETMDNAGNVLNKMVQFWSYFSYNFTNPKKVFKTIKKTKNLANYNAACKKAFCSLY